MPSRSMTAFDRLRTAMTNGIEQLQPGQPRSRRLDPEVTSTVVMAVFDGPIIQWLLEPSRLPTGEAIAETLQRAAVIQQATPLARRPAGSKPG